MTLRISVVVKKNKTFKAKQKILTLLFVYTELMHQGPMHGGQEVDHGTTFPPPLLLET